MNNIFARTEKKYILTKEQFKMLIEELREYIIEDRFSNYQICNIYYDTDNFDLFRLSIDKPLYKEKLRLRSYGTPSMDDMVFVEVKKKFKGVVYKRRIDLPLREAYNFINNDDVTHGGSINEREIRYLLNRYELLPQVYLSYSREAYTWVNDKNLRITFDSDMKYRTQSTGLENGNDGAPIVDGDTILMEIKSLNALPLELTSTLNNLGIYPTSFSKIGTVYRNKIIPQQRKETTSCTCQ